MYINLPKNLYFHIQLGICTTCVLAPASDGALHNNDPTLKGSFSTTKERMSGRHIQINISL